MSKSRNSAALPAHLIVEGESPKEFLKRHRPPKNWNPQARADRQIQDYSLENYGIEHNQYWQGVSTAHTEWDEVYVGVGDTPLEAGDDAISEASIDFDTEGVVNDLPEVPSVSDDITNQARTEAEASLDRDDYETDEDYYDAVTEKADEIVETGEWELNCYAVLWIKRFGAHHESLSEADETSESPEQRPFKAKAFIKGLVKQKPPNWPLIKRWYREPTGVARTRAFTTSQSWTGQQRRHSLRNTYFMKYPRPGEHALRLHGTDVLYYDGQGNVVVTSGNWKTRLTRDRINTFLPNGWHISQYRYDWYWYNQNWPQEINQSIWSDMRKRRRATSKYWIPFSNGDKIDQNGTLHFYGGGTAKTNGEIVNPVAIHEGRYFDKLARFKRMKAKFDKMREVKKRIKEIEDLDKPAKQEEGQAKDFLKKIGGRRVLKVGEEVSHGTANPEEVIDACLDKLKEIDTSAFTRLSGEYEEVTAEGSDQHEFLYEVVESVMQKRCPPLTYFGSHPGDGSRIGCWPYEELTYVELAQEGRIEYAAFEDNDTRHKIQEGIENAIPESSAQYGVVYKEYYSYTCYDRQGNVVWDY